MSSPQETRIMLVEDHASFRQPLAFLLEREPNFSVVAQAGSLAEAREELGKAAVDLAVVDLELPDGSGEQVIADLRASRPQPLVLVLSAHANPARLAGAIEAGAEGVLPKSSRVGEIAEAVRRLRSGKQLIPPEDVVEAFQLIGRRSRDEAMLLIDKLTPMECELLEAIAGGSNDEEAARRLSVGVETVRSHVAGILSKLEVDSMLKALLFATNYGVVKTQRPSEGHG